MSVRPAATLILSRNGPGGIEVVMGHRPPGGVFGDVWVFPGGAVDDADLRRATDAEQAWMLAAVRETAEEVGIVLARPAGSVTDVRAGDDLYARLEGAGAEFDLGRLVYLSNWVTPRFVPRRFDTRFFLVSVSEPVEPAVITGEFVSVGWVDVAEALRRHHAGSMPLIFPTLAHLRYISGFGSVESLEAEARSLELIPQIEPRMFERGDHVELIVSGDPRFEP